MNARKIPCVLLAGGLSRRMGGGHKFEKIIKGQPMLDRILSRLEPQVGDILLNANSPLETTSYPVATDIAGGHLGPLAGILTGLSYFRDKGYVSGHMLVCPCDIPFVPKDLVSKLQSVLQGGGKEASAPEIVMASSNDRIHPVISLWPFAVLEDLRKALLEEDLRKILVFAKRYQLHEVSWGAGEDPFFNVNTPEDLALAETRAEFENVKLD